MGSLKDREEIFLPFDFEELDSNQLNLKRFFTSTVNLDLFELKEKISSEIEPFMQKKDLSQQEESYLKEEILLYNLVLSKLNCNFKRLQECVEKHISFLIDEDGDVMPIQFQGEEISPNTEFVEFWQ